MTFQPPVADLVVHTEGLAKRFGSVEAVRSADLRVPRNSIFGFLGPNGAGKTTTLRMLVGLLSPTAGHGTVLGCDITGDTLELRRQVGYLPQQPRFYPDLSARETLRFAARFFYRDGPAVRKRIDGLIDMAGLGSRADRPVGAFSGGERQRLGIAQAQLHSPQLLILDEPAADVTSSGCWRNCGPRRQFSTPPTFSTTSNASATPWRSSPTAKPSPMPRSSNCSPARRGLSIGW